LRGKTISETWSANGRTAATVPSVDPSLTTVISTAVTGVAATISARAARQLATVVAMASSSL